MLKLRGVRQMVATVILCCLIQHGLCYKATVAIIVLSDCLFEGTILNVCFMKESLRYPWKLIFQWKHSRLFPFPF